MKDTTTKNGKSRAAGAIERATEEIAGSLLGILEKEGVFEEESNPLAGAFEVERKLNKKIHLRAERFQFKPGVSTGDKGERHVSLDVSVNECYAGQLLFHPARGVWYFLTDPQPMLDGTEAGDIAGESSDFTAAVRGLCKSKWPKLWKEMDL